MVEVNDHMGDRINMKNRKSGLVGVTAVYGASGTDGRRLAWPLLERAVRLRWGWTELPPTECSPRGKPLFRGLENRWFSLSHSGGLALCALSDFPVGVDIEIVRPRRSGLPRRLLSGNELAAFDGTWADFYRVWTLTESWCKREDAPLYPPRAVETPPPCPYKSYAGADWRGAVCCHDAPPEDIIWLELLCEKEETV